jgi:hypothetical protein
MPRRHAMGPPLAALVWAAQAVGRGARIARVRRLVGGISSVVHSLSVVSTNGTRHELVLRRRVGQDVVVRESHQGPGRPHLG